MKKQILIGSLALLTLVNVSQATLFSYTYDITDTLIPDANPAGITDSHVVPSVAGGNVTDQIVNVDVRLNISGGFNGDLYGYLVLQNGQGTFTSILLNRVGRTGAADFGYGTAGFGQITLSGYLAGGYANIHDVSAPDNLQPYLADGRTTNPTGDFTGATSTAGLDVLNTHNANGTWTLFLADLSGGDQSTLLSWGLDITVVPEPTTWAMLTFGSLVGVCALLRRMRRQQTA